MSGILIRAAALISGTEVIRSAAIRVADGLIESVGPSADVKSHPDDDVFEFPNGTLLPGLVNCHEHLSGHDRFAIGDASVTESDVMYGLVATFHANRLLNEGITTARIPGAPGHIDLELRRAIELGYVRGPRLICAGRHLAMTGGHGSVSGREVDGKAEAIKAAREQLRAGADFIKVVASGGVGITRIGEEPVQPELTVEEMSATIEVAHSAGKRVTAHADGERGIQNALDAGVDCIEHGIYLTRAQATEMANRNIALVPTLSTMRGIAFRGREYGMPESWIPIAEAVLKPHLTSFREALEAGVTFGTGTDGFGELVEEIEIFAECGLSPLESILAATDTSARIAAPSPLFGRLEPGLAADVLAVEGDPLENLSALRNPEVVIAGGVLHKRP